MATITEKFLNSDFYDKCAFIYYYYYYYYYHYYHHHHH